jgi:hypothetical protein
MDKEITTLKQAGTWHDIPHPENKNIVGSKWVFQVKHKANRSVNKYKAHLIA